MKGQKLETLDINIPGNFPSNSYDAICRRMGKKRDEFPEATMQFKGGWNAVAYRFLSCSEYNENFTLSVKKVGHGPPQPDRYIQEKELFNFFVTGVSVIESFCFALFAISSIIDKEIFPIHTEGDLKYIRPERTLKRLMDSEFFKNKTITITLKGIIESQDYKVWKEARNILAHRVAPLRHYVLSSGNQKGASWIEGIQITENTTLSRFKWLTKSITNLLNDLDVLTFQLF